MMSQLVQLEAFVICEAKLIVINFNLILMMNHVSMRRKMI